MARYHEVKIWPSGFEAIRSGRRCDIRRNDRNYEAGDLLWMREWSPENRRYTGRAVSVKITDVLHIAGMDTPIKNVLGLNPCMAPVNELVILSLDARENALSSAA